MKRGCDARHSTSWATAAALCAGLIAIPVSLDAQAAALSAPPALEPASGAALLATIQALTGPGMDGRATGTPGGLKARAWIEARLVAIGVKPASGSGYEQPFSFTSAAGGTVSGTNLVALCRGSRADAPAIVVSAHYDHLGVRNGEIHHGADDNASGVAMLLAVAERCVKAPFAHPLLLVAFDAEEQGLQGARAFLARPPVPAARIALNVNFDMVGRSDRSEIYVAGPGRWPRLLPLLTPAARQTGITVKFGHDTGGGQDDWTAQSDHGVFHGAGIPFVYFGVEDHADYHKPTDTAAKIAPLFLDRVAAVVLASLAALDGAAAYK
jgi:Zn-dependent M28 family amino/carboxypeptidase